MCSFLASFSLRVSGLGGGGSSGLASARGSCFVLTLTMELIIKLDGFGDEFCFGAGVSGEMDAHLSAQLITHFIEELVSLNTIRAGRGGGKLFVQFVVDVYDLLERLSGLS